MDDMETRKKRSIAESATTADYEIQIMGTLHERWSSWFGDMAIIVKQREDPSPRTIFHCPAMDQVRLRGVLNMIWDLNLELVSVRRLPPEAMPDSIKNRSEIMEENDE
jgi:hypothetical protein